jgi:hypothetical protein
MIFQYKQNHDFGQYRFEVIEDYRLEIPELFGQAFHINDQRYFALVNISKTVMLLINKGYAWNGMGTVGLYPTTKKTARASCAHDTFYQMMRLGLLPQTFRLTADNIFRRICKDDGEWGWTVEIYYTLIRLFGAGAAKPELTKGKSV